MNKKKLNSNSMQHETLGAIKIDPANGEANATIQFEDRQVSVKIIPDEVSLEESLQLAAEVVRDLTKIVATAKQVAASELCETYNDGWNEYEQAQADGSFKSVSNPELSEYEFTDKLSLDAINILGDSMVDMFLEDENMFWGHAVIVTSRNGADLKEDFAELFG